MTPEAAARMLAETMNAIEAEGFILYPHPRPVGISIRRPKPGITPVHPDHTLSVAQIWDEGDGRGWQVRE